MSDDELRGRASEGINILNRLNMEMEFCEQDRHHVAKGILKDISTQLEQRVKLYETVLDHRTKDKGGENHESIHHTDSPGPEQDQEVRGDQPEG